MQEMTALKGITYMFNPPGACQFGNAHQAMVKAAKKPNV